MTGHSCSHKTVKMLRAFHSKNETPFFCINYSQREERKVPSIFRVIDDRNYTVMSKYHLIDCNLSLKVKGLLFGGQEDESRSVLYPSC